MTVTWTSIIKLNRTGCRLHSNLKKGHFTLVILWCGRSAHCHVVTVKISRDACYAAPLHAREPRYELMLR